MRILVYPHAMEIGGSQLNAIELAAAVRDRGHHVAVVSDDGPLVERVRALGLEHLRGVRVGRRPSPARVRQLRRVVREGRYDVVHGYEWPPILEAWLATRRRRGARAFGTVMSMAVADFLPGHLPLVVGTRRIARASEAMRDGVVHVIEPPVDTRLNCPDPEGAVAPDVLAGLPPGTVVVVIVSRVVKELKLEGILSAVRAVGELATRHPVHLLVVGAGSELGTVAAEAARVNANLPTPAVTLTGELDDPRGAYSCADVCIGMGGSALRSLAFGQPLVVQGEGGFFETLTPESLDLFLEQGFYGLDRRDQDGAVRHLVGLLEPLVTDAVARRTLGDWGRELVVDRFSLEAAAAVQERCYLEALEAPGGVRTRDVVEVSRRFAAYKGERLWSRARGRLATDDFNSKPA